MGAAPMGVNDVTVCVPSIPPRRNSLLPVALKSVWMQVHPIDAVSVAVDVNRQGAARTRQRALDAALTEWVAFLDDDDVLYPQHIEHLLSWALENQADYTFSYFDLTRTANVFASRERPMGHFGRTFDPEDPHHTTMTILVRRELAQAVGFSDRPEGDIAGGEDWRFLLGCVDAGAKIVHLPEQTWFWRHHDSNTSGREDRW
jgi:glycosyltransferase involved in cell wall biosynthesis